MKINLRYEGGAGDILCAHRFLRGLKEQYPNAEITAYLDTEGNPMQESWLRAFYPNEYTNIVTIPSKKYKPFYVSSQFNSCEKGVGAFENIPDEYQNKIKNADLWFDMWIDGLSWTKYPWALKYFHSFPTPHIKNYEQWYIDGLVNGADPLLFGDDFFDISKPYAFLHLVPNNFKGNTNVNEAWYRRRLTQQLAAKIPCIVIETPLTIHLLQELGEIPNVKVVRAPEIEEVAYLIAKSSIFIGTDSGLKYLAHGLNIPRLIYAAYSHAPHQVASSHLIRWLTEPADYIPVHYDTNYVVDLATRIVENPVVSLIPQVKNFELECVQRKYKVNLEESKLQ